VALIIGNSNYEKSPLRNCVNDANDLSGKLREIGFRVTQKTNLNSEQMERETDDFPDIIEPGDFVFFHFAGHGIQWEDQNYLIPCDDKNIQGTYDLKYRAINAQRLLERLSSKNPYVIIFFLDCCRNYTAPSMARSLPIAGLVQMSAPAGSVIAFACAPGKTASDGAASGRNGIFTKHILRHIAKPGEEVLMLLVDITKGVSNETNGAQEPYVTSSLKEHNIWFVPPTNNSKYFQNF
jgi:uncharacterized caspase-like protein